jgi:type I restriction enzyme S subunit
VRGMSLKTEFRVGITQRPVAFNQDIKALVPREGIDPYYLAYAIRAATDDVLDMVEEAGHGTGVLPTERLRHLQIWLPDKCEQIEIATLMKALDTKVETNRKINRNLGELARALFKCWFIDFDPVVARRDGRRPFGMDAGTAALFPEDFEPSELGQIPKGWMVRGLTELAEFTRGKSYKSSELVESDTALVTLKSFLRGGGYREDGLKGFTGVYKPSQVVNPGEIIVACTDVTQNAEVIGRSAQVLPTSTFKILVASLDVLIARPRAAGESISYLAEVLRSDDYVQHVLGYVNGTTVLHLDTSGLSDYRLAVPIAPIRAAFSAIVDPVYRQFACNTVENEALAKLRDLLLSKLMSGEVRLKDAERIVSEAV